MIPDSSPPAASHTNLDVTCLGPSKAGHALMAVQVASSSATASTATPFPVKLKLAPSGKRLLHGGWRLSMASFPRAWLLEVSRPGSACPEKARVGEELRPQLAFPQLMPGDCCPCPELNRHPMQLITKRMQSSHRMLQLETNMHTHNYRNVKTSWDA